MTTDVVVSWIGSIIAIVMWSQVAATAIWMIAHFKCIASSRERRDTFFSACVALLYVIVKFILVLQETGGCHPWYLESAEDLFAIGSANYILQSLKRKHQFYLFARQQDAVFERRKERHA